MGIGMLIEGTEEATSRSYNKVVGKILYVDQNGWWLGNHTLVRVRTQRTIVGRVLFLFILGERIDETSYRRQQFSFNVRGHAFFGD